MRKDYSGEFFADRMNILYEVVEDGEIMEVRDGHPFSYPACILKEVNGDKVITVGKCHMDGFLTKAAMPKIAAGGTERLKDCLQEFSDALDLASECKYLSDKEAQQKIETVSGILAKSYMDLGFKSEEGNTFCQKQTIEFLRSYTTYILSHMELVQILNKKEQK